MRYWHQEQCISHEYQCVAAILIHHSNAAGQWMVTTFRALLYLATSHNLESAAEVPAALFKNADQYERKVSALAGHLPSQVQPPEGGSHLERLLMGREHSNF